MTALTSVVEKYNIPALEKGLDVLELLSSGPRPLTQAQIARELSRSPNEMFRVLSALERRGYISRNVDSGAYTLTLRLFELAHTRSPFRNLVRVAEKPMQALASELGQC